MQDQSIQNYKGQPNASLGILLDITLKLTRKCYKGATVSFCFQWGFTQSWDYEDHET